MPDRDGVVRNVCLRLHELADYAENPSNFGAIVGPFANRIGRAGFSLDGERYELPANNGPNSLHSGPANLAHRAWTVRESSDRHATFTIEHRHAAGGLPGPIAIQATYTVDGNTLTLGYEATSPERPAIINLTNHAYWNLGGLQQDGRVPGDVRGHVLQIDADQRLVVDENVLPTGEIVAIEQTPFDFRTPRAIGDTWESQRGYDHCFVLRPSENRSHPRRAATIADPQSGRRLTVETTQPGVQLYTANHFGGEDSNAGHQAFDAFCLECQHFPNSPNMPTFPSTRLAPGDTYRESTRYTFTTDDR